MLKGDNLVFVGVASLLFFPFCRGIFLSVDWAGLLLTYFVWLGRTNREKRPLYTRGGLLNYTGDGFAYTNSFVLFGWPREFSWLPLCLQSVWVPSARMRVPLTDCSNFS
jgi:hypothetical protein